MKISNHKIEGHWAGQSPNVGGALTNPTLLVIHFTASGGGTGKGDVDYFKQRAAKASAHVVIGRDGSLFQVVPFNQQAWHAGRSIWRGRSNCNDHSIGIELDNWGKLTKTADGKLRSWTKAVVSNEDAALMKHKNEDREVYWELYTPDQLEVLEDVCREILKAYPSIKEIVGHDDIAPGRKADPGPAFPMSRIRSAVAGRGDRTSVRRRTISSLNMRGGPGLQHKVIRTLPKGTVVNVVYDMPGDWAQLDNGAWVNDRYLSGPL